MGSTSVDFFGESKQSLPKNEDVWEVDRRGYLFKAARTCTSSEELNRPCLRGTKSTPLSHPSALIAGFEETMDLLIAQKDTLNNELGPLRGFRDCCVRYVLRQTQAYTTFLTNLSQPRFLHSPQQRSQAFAEWNSPKGEVLATDVLDAEREDLAYGDVPYFFGYANSQKVLHGETILEQQIYKSPFSVLKENIQIYVSTHAKMQQRQILLNSLLVLKNRLQDKNHPIPSKLSLPDSGKRSDLPWKILDFLNTQALRYEDKVQWSSLGLNKNGVLNQSLLPLGFYEGVSGLGFVFSQVSKMGGFYSQKYADLSARIGQLLELALEQDRGIKGLGYFGGEAGILQTLFHMDAVQAKIRYRSYLGKLLLSDFTHGDWDFIGGFCGILPFVCQHKRDIESTFI